MAATGTHHYDAVTGIKAAIEELTLTGIDGAGSGGVGSGPLPADRVYTRELLTDRNVTLPCVVVSYAPMPEDVSIMDDANDQVGYPCIVAVLVKANQETALTEGPSKWRQQIEGLFNLKANAILAAAMDDDLTLLKTEWRPLDVVDLSAFHDRNLFVSAAIVVVYVVKPRG